MARYKVIDLFHHIKERNLVYRRIKSVDEIERTLNQYATQGYRLRTLVCDFKHNNGFLIMEKEVNDEANKV